MRRNAETNEVMAFKLHYLAYIVGEVAKCRYSNSMVKQFEIKILSTEDLIYHTC